MKAKTFLSLCLGLSLSLSIGCGSSSTSSNVASPTASITPSSTEAPKGEISSEDSIPNILINQIGYLPKDSKIAVFRGEHKGENFDVVSTTSGKTVYTGTIGESIFSSSCGERCCQGDFSSVSEPDTYKISLKDAGESYTFTIGDDIYKDLFKDSVRFFYLQRCGQEVPEKYGTSWAHPACHTEMATIYGTETKIDVSGGWHDAGDYGRYVVATSKAVADLLLAYEINPDAFGDDFDIPESGNGIPDVLDEVRYQLDWLFKMQDPKSGGVYHKVTCAKFPDFVMPQEETDPLIVCPISTTATGDFAAIMALASDIYKEIDPELSKKCLVSAEKAWDYLDSTPSSSVDNPEGIVTGAYEDDYDKDERLWAASQLFKTTGNKKYFKIVEDYFTNDPTIFDHFDYGWQSVGLYAQGASATNPYIEQKIRDNFKNTVDDVIKPYRELADFDPYGVCSDVNRYYWGSNMGFLSTAAFMSQADDLTQSSTNQKYVQSILDYCLGKNPLGISYVTGYGTVYPCHPHHRPTVATGKVIPGMLVGGPNQYLNDEVALNALKSSAPAKCYIDETESYSTNEVDIYWNSSLVYLLAKFHKV